MVKRNSITYAQKRLIEKAIQAHIDADLPKFKDTPTLAASLTETLGFKVSPGNVTGIFREVEELDRSQICRREAVSQGQSRKPINLLREEVQELRGRIEKLEKFVNDFR